MPYVNLGNDLLALQRFDEARQVIQEAQTRKLDDYILHIAALRRCLPGIGLIDNGGTAAVVCEQPRG